MNDFTIDQIQEYGEPETVDPELNEAESDDTARTQAEIDMAEETPSGDEEEGGERSEIAGDEQEEGDSADENEEPDEEGDEQATTSLFDSVNEDFGYEFTEEERATFTEDDAGLKNFINAVSKRQIENTQKEMFESLPEDSRQYLAYIANGGDPNKYWQADQKARTYETTELDTSDTNQLKTVYADYLSRKGFSKEKVAKLVTLSEDSDSLEEDAKGAFEEMKQEDVAAKEQLLQTQKEEAKAQRKQAEEQRNNVINTIKELNDVHGFKFPEAEKAELQKYFTEADREGYTPYMRDMAQMSLEEQILLGNMVRKKFKLGEYIKREAATQKTKSVYDRLKTGGGKRINGGQTRQFADTKEDLTGVSVDDI